MSALIGYVTALLVSALAIFGIGESGNVAQVWQTQTNNNQQLVTFIKPAAGDAISAERQTIVQWEPVSPGLQEKFKGFWLELDIIDPSGKSIGSIGDGFHLNETSTIWNIPYYLDNKFYTLEPWYYTVRASLHVGQELSLGCDPSHPAGPKDCVLLYSDETKELIQEAQHYVSDSTPFLVIDLSPQTPNDPTLTPGHEGPNTGVAPDGSMYVKSMEKYTDTDFGFSFWYPSGWVVSNSPAQTTDRVGNAVVGQIKMSGPGIIITIDKVHSTNLTYHVESGACGYCGPLTYFFDPNQHLWMKKYPNGLNGAPEATSEQMDSAKVAQPADVSRNTMGGLHMLNTEQRENATIVPLSGQNFLFVKGVTYTDACGPYCASPEVKGDALFLAKTVVATDPSVATPVSADEQIKTIQAEKDAYATQ